MAIHKCNICGGDLILTIGSDRAVCDHCGQAAAVAPQDVKKYQDIYQTAETLMRTDTLSGYADAMQRLQVIAFIPQAKEQIAVCEQRIKALKQAKADIRRPREKEDKKSAKIGVILFVLLLVFLLAVVAGIGYAIYRLIHGNLSQTEVIVLASVAAAFLVVVIIGKIRR